MNPVFSILHATRGRPEKAASAMQMWHDRAQTPQIVEYLVSVDDDDGVRIKIGAFLNDKNFSSAGVIVTKNTGSAMAWNEAARRSSGELLIQAQDDVEPPHGWDDLLLKRLPDNWSDQFIFVRVSDGYRKDDLCCTAIMTRKRMDQEGHFLFPGYISVFSDDEVTYRAFRDSRGGECKIIDARDVIFLHRHHYHDSAVPWDQTYARENSPEAYNCGMKLFFERNPQAATDGIRNWA